jgi:hypothetical protein
MFNIHFHLLPSDLNPQYLPDDTADSEHEFLVFMLLMTSP